LEGLLAFLLEELDLGGMKKNGKIEVKVSVGVE
jgi:hypothetical protein